MILKLTTTEGATVYLAADAIESVGTGEGSTVVGMKGGGGDDCIFVVKESVEAVVAMWFRSSYVVDGVVSGDGDRVMVSRADAAALERVRGLPYAWRASANKDEQAGNDPGGRWKQLRACADVLEKVLAGG